VKKHKPKPQPTSPLSAPDGFAITPVGNADRFLRDYGSDFLWIEGIGLNSAGTFYWWNGLRWEENNSRAVELAQQTVRDLGKLVAMAVKDQYSAQEIAQLVQFWKSSEADYKMREILSIAKPHIVFDRGKFDANPDLLGLRNGTLNLRDESFRGPAKEDFITKACNVTYDPEAQCPAWEKFLCETTGGDPELLRYLRQCIGLTLTGSQKEHLFFIVVGPAATGKSTFHECLQYMFGDYSCSIDPNSLGATKSEAGRARPDIAKLPGMRFVLANESRSNLRLDEGLIKSLSGGDTFCARQLFEAEFDFIPSFKLWLRTNTQPSFDGGDSGMQRRIRKVPFTHIVPDGQRDKSLPEVLRQEAAGILNWALAGLRDYQLHGLLEPAIVKEETAEYIKSLDVIGRFISEKCEVGSYTVSAGQLYTEYKCWIPTPTYAVSDSRFKSELIGRGFTPKHTKSGNVWVGIRMAELQQMPACDVTMEA
jgi:putative DNA primase/helicase